MEEIFKGRTYTSSMIVEEKHTARAQGSGDLDVLATPIMIGLMENAAMNAVKTLLDKGYTTVGGYIETSHIKPSAIGEYVEATATVVKVEGKKLYYQVEAKCHGTLIGEGKHLRFIVDSQKFISTLNKK